MKVDRQVSFSQHLMGEVKKNKKSFFPLPLKGSLLACSSTCHPQRDTLEISKPLEPKARWIDANRAPV